MIASWMLYCALCALGLSLAAVVAERALLAGRGPVRHVWLVAVVLSLAVPFVAFRFAPRRIAEPVVIAATDASVPADDAVVGDPSSRLPVPAPSGTSASSRLPVIPSSGRPSTSTWRSTLSAAVANADRPLAILWFSLSLALALYWIAGMVLLRQARRAWRPENVHGVDVLVSEKTGPALVGAAAPAIVVPEWALALEPAQLSLMLRHEQEHRRARDGQLLFAAQFSLIAMPWNVALWWQVMRLRVAVELDCDARVLRDADARSYGDLLLEVVRPRPALAPMGATAFAERATQLERRIRVIASKRDGVVRTTRAVAGFVALAAVSIAWIAPRPPVPAIAAPAATPAVQSPSVPNVPAAQQATDSAAQRAEAPKPETKALVSAADSLRLAAAHRDSVQRDSTRRDSIARAAQPRDSVARRDSAPVITLPPILGGRGNVIIDPVQAADTLYTTMFGGITMSADQESQARAVVNGLVRAQIAQNDSLRPLQQAHTARLAQWRAERDSALLALITNEMDRALVYTRLAPPGGGRRGGGPPPDGSQPGGARGGGGGAGGRGNPAGGGRGGPGTTAPDPAQLAEQAFRRIYDSVTLTPDQEAKARAAIMKLQTAQASTPMPSAPPKIQLRPFNNAVMIEAKSDSVLVGLLTNEEDRAKLRARLINPPPPIRQQ